MSSGVWRRLGALAGLIEICETAMPARGVQFCGVAVGSGGAVHPSCRLTNQLGPERDPPQASGQGKRRDIQVLRGFGTLNL